MRTFINWLLGRSQESKRAMDSLAEMIASEQPTASGKAAAIEVFDKICDLLGFQAGKQLSAKSKRTVMRRLLSSFRHGRPTEFMALAVEQMQSQQKAHLRAADTAAKRAMMKSCRAVPVSVTAGTPEGLAVLAGLPARTFYKTPEWRRLRIEAFAAYGCHCMRCGARPGDDTRLYVMHRRPRGLRPDLAFDVKNLWVLCGDCRQGELVRSHMAREEARHAG